jgi:hypothetical protein
MSPRLRLLPFALVLLAPACKKKPPPAAKPGTSASAAVVASVAPAPSASVAEIPDAASDDAAVATDRTVAAGTTPAGFHLAAFTLRALDDSPGLAFGKAVEACAVAGKFLCSEAEWQRACAESAELAKAETWTYTAERERVVVRGGDGNCEKRSVVNPADANGARATLCCDRAIGVQSGDADAAQKIGAELVVFERGLRERKAEDIAQVTLETLVFAGKELKREELLPASLAALLPDASEEPVLFDSCSVRPGAEDAGPSSTLECLAARLRPSGPEELRWRLATQGADHRLSRIELPAPPAPSEQKQRVGGFLR